MCATITGLPFFALFVIEYSTDASIICDENVRYPYLENWPSTLLLLCWPSGNKPQRPTGMPFYLLEESLWLCAQSATLNSRTSSSWQRTIARHPTISIQNQPNVGSWKVFETSIVAKDERRDSRTTLQDPASSRRQESRIRRVCCCGFLQHDKSLIQNRTINPARICVEQRNLA